MRDEPTIPDSELRVTDRVKRSAERCAGRSLTFHATRRHPTAEMEAAISEGAAILDRKVAERRSYAQEQSRLRRAVRHLWLTILDTLFGYCRRCCHDSHRGACQEGHPGYWIGPTYVEANGCLCGNPEFDQ